MKKPPDVIMIDDSKNDIRKINLMCLIMWAHENNDDYLLMRALQRLNQLP